MFDMTSQPTSRMYQKKRFYCDITLKQLWAGLSHPSLRLHLHETTNDTHLLHHLV